MKQVDKHFKNHLEHHESDVPADMWSRIAPALEEKSRRGIPLLWLFSGISLLLVGALAYTTFAPEVSSYGGTLTVPAADSTVGVTAAATTLQDLASTQKNEDEASMSQTIAAVDRTQQQAGSLADSETVAASSLRSLATANIDVEANGNEADIASVDLASDNDISGTPSTASSFKLKITKSYFDGTDRIVDKRSTMTVAGEARSYTEKVSYITLPLTKEEHVSDIPADLQPKFSLFKASTPQCPSFLDKGRVGFFVDTYLSHDVAIKHSTSSNLGYLSEREQTESGQYSYGAGVRLSYFLGKGFGIRSGVHYSQLNEKFAFEDPDGSQITTKEVTVTVTNADGTTSTVTTIETVEVPGRRSVTHGNKYHFLDIPVLAFYEFGKKNSPFYYSVNAGTHFNLLFRQSGKYLAPDGEVVSLTGDDEYPSPFSNRVGVSLYASFGLHYVLNDAMDISIEPHFSTQLTTATMARADVSQRFSTVGINTGIRYKF